MAGADGGEEITPANQLENDAERGSCQQDLKEGPEGNDAKKPAVILPPATSIFELKAHDAGAKDGAPGAGPRTGSLLGMATPMFSVLTSKGLPLNLTPEVLKAQLPGRQMFQLPAGDLVLRQDVVAKCPGSEEGCTKFYPHLKDHVTYCSFRNPRLNPSVHGGDAVCSVETVGGRRKVGPKEILALQRVMHNDIIACPGEELTCDVIGRRVNRAMSRASEWLKDLLESKAQNPELGFEWHVLASIPGTSDLKLREKACENAASMPVAGFWIGGLGYNESLRCRAQVLDCVNTALPAALPRFLPLNSGSPVEILQAVLLGVDVLEVAYPNELASKGIALNFEWEMPEGDACAEEALEPLLPYSESAASHAPLRVVKSLKLSEPQHREDFGPINQDSPVKQYSRAYIYHLLMVRELLGTILLTQHNLHAYSCFFASLRHHIEKGTLRSYASWFMKTQTCEARAVEESEGRNKKRRKIG